MSQKDMISELRIEANIRRLKLAKQTRKSSGGNFGYNSKGRRKKKTVKRSE